MWGRKPVVSFTVATTKRQPYLWQPRSAVPTEGVTDAHRHIHTMNGEKMGKKKKISKVGISGILWPRHTIQTLECRYKSKLSTWDSTFALAFIVFSSQGKAHSPLLRFPSGKLSSHNFSSSFMIKTYLQNIPINYESKISECANITQLQL